MTPPWLVRRLVLAPLVVALELAALVAAAPLAVVAVVLSPLFGGWRPVRMLAIAVVFVVRHLMGILGCLGLWVASGFGALGRTRRVQDRHYALLRWFVGGIYRAIVDIARVEVTVDESDAARAVLDGHRPVLLFSRHSGQGDSLLVLHQLLCRHRRHPRIVMHERLRLDPLIDVLGHRLPNRFVDPRGGDTEKEIAAMSRDLDPDGAVLLFPEGGNVSEERRRRSIERLEQAGHAEEAGWARELRHLAAPRPGGTLAAMGAAPAADVVFLAHTGLPATLGDVWRLIPDTQPIRLRYWVAPRDEVPDDRDAQIDWLFAWWRRIDRWVSEQAGG